MEIMEIILLAAGSVIFVLSFLIPDKNTASGGKDGVPENAKLLAQEEIRGLVSQELDSIKEHVDDVVEEAVGYAIEKTERSLERLSNEKIMAVSEYSDTVLSEIHKNHEEAMFLYDMLNNKHTNLKNTVSEVNRTVKEAEETVMNFQKLAPEGGFTPWEESSADAKGEPPVGSRAESFTPRRMAGGAAQQSAVRPQVQPETRRSGPEPTGMQRAGIQRAGTENAGIQNAGIQKNGTERNGIQRNGTERNGTGKTGIERTGTRRSGLERLGAVPEPATESAPYREEPIAAAEEPGRNNNERILELYKQGKSTVLIARELGLGVGEVKLVIDLFKHQ